MPRAKRGEIWMAEQRLTRGWPRKPSKTNGYYLGILGSEIIQRLRLSRD